MKNDKKSTENRVSRRKGIDQIFRHPNLSTTEKLIGFAVWRRVNRSKGFTFAHVSTLARDVGIKHDVARESLKRLAALGLLRIKDGGPGSAELTPLPLYDREGPVMRCGDRAFEAELRNWLDEVLVDVRLTPATRIAAYAIASWIDPIAKTSDCNFRRLGEHVGLSERTVRRAANNLIAADRISAVTRRHASWEFGIVPTESDLSTTREPSRAFADTSPTPHRGTGQMVGHEVGQQVGHLVGQEKVDSLDISTVISAKSVPNLTNRFNRSNPHRPTVYALAEARRGQWEGSASPVRHEDRIAPDYDSFDHLLYLIDDYANASDGDLFRISGLIACINWNDRDHITYADDIHPHIKSGLLQRVDRYGRPAKTGDFLSITEAGYAARDRDLDLKIAA